LSGENRKKLNSKESTLLNYYKIYFKKISAHVDTAVDTLYLESKTTVLVTLVYKTTYVGRIMDIQELICSPIGSASELSQFPLENRIGYDYDSQLNTSLGTRFL
jgi:hypothetical protein